VPSEELARSRGMRVGITHNIGAMRLADSGELDSAEPVENRRPVHLRMCELLWPPPAAVTMYDSGRRQRRSEPDAAGAEDAPRTSELALIPSLRRTPLLVPADYRLAAAAIRHGTGQRSRAARLTTKLFSFSLASGLGEPVLRARIRISAPAGAETIETHLASVLSRDPADIRVSMYLGPARANRKPVLQVLTPDGQPLAFAKIGINPLTCELVRREQTALTTIGQAGLAGRTVPQVLHHDQWHGLEILVLSVVPAWLHNRPLRPGELGAAMAAVSRVSGVHSGPVAGSSYLAQLRQRLGRASEGSEQAALLHALETLVSRAGGVELDFGAWHGDWSPWNMANTRRGLLVWDWERFTVGVPLGYDALHHRLQAELGPGHRAPLAAAAATPQYAAQLLAPFGATAAQAKVTGLLYLTDLATRYLVDQQARLGARNGAPGRWLIPTISREVARL
jgi:hypothetical protein